MIVLDEVKVLESKVKGKQNENMTKLRKSPQLIEQNKKTGQFLGRETSTTHEVTTLLHTSTI